MEGRSDKNDMSIYVNIYRGIPGNRTPRAFTGVLTLTSLYKAIYWFFPTVTLACFCRRRPAPQFLLLVGSCIRYRTNVTLLTLHLWSDHFYVPNIRPLRLPRSHRQARLPLWMGPAINQMVDIYSSIEPRCWVCLDQTALILAQQIYNKWDYGRPVELSASRTGFGQVSFWV